MARPKGSKNKTVERVTVEQTVEAQSWTPAPDMGKIQPPPPSEKLCSKCGHKRSMHYEGNADHCNTQGCPCNAWKE